MDNTITCSHCDQQVKLPEEILKQSFNVITTCICSHCDSILNIWIKPVKAFEVISHYHPKK